MTVWQIIRGFNYTQLWQLFILAIKYPIYVYPTLKATVQSFQIAKNLYPETHGKKGKANAFRHALWNAVICFECAKWRKNRRRIIAWAKLITDKHEQLSPNAPLDEQMDLHNNKIGRNLFIASNFDDQDEIIKVLQTKLNSAKMIATIVAIEDHKSEMVYIH